MIEWMRARARPWTGRKRGRDRWMKGYNTMIESSKPNGSLCERCGCGGEYIFSRHCGVGVCSGCDAHQGLERCYCGWSKAFPGRGRAELEEAGEQIDADY